MLKYIKGFSDPHHHSIPSYHSVKRVLCFCTKEKIIFYSTQLNQKSK